MSRLAEVVRVVGLITESVRVAGQITNGALYAVVLPHLPQLDELATYTAALRMAEGARLIAREGHSLRWIGPLIDDRAGLQ